MEGGGSSLGSKGKKPIGTRRSWNQKEESILMDQLKELVALPGWKTEKGFRPGYLMKLEEKMREQIPGTDIRGSPHINSRITIWKRHHGCLQTALGETGGGFNTVTKIIDVSDTAWDKAVKKEPTVAGMRYKPWPFYYDWLEVFGCDRATGKASEDVIDAANDPVKEDVQAHVGENVQGDNPVPINKDSASEMDVESKASTGETAKASTSSGKKRKAHPQSEKNKVIIDGIADLFKSSDERLVNMVKELVVEDHGVKIRKEVFSMLERIPDLTLDERLDASVVLTKNQGQSDMFSGFPEHARPCFLRRLLDGHYEMKK